MNLKKFQLSGEDESSYHISHPNGKSISVDKAGLTEKAHQAILKMEKAQHFARGGTAGNAHYQRGYAGKYQYCPRCDKEHPNCLCGSGKSDHYAEGGEVGNSCLEANCKPTKSETKSTKKKADIKTAEDWWDMGGVRMAEGGMPLGASEGLHDEAPYEVPIEPQVIDGKAESFADARARVEAMSPEQVEAYKAAATQAKFDSIPNQAVALDKPAEAVVGAAKEAVVPSAQVQPAVAPQATAMDVAAKERENAFTKEADLYKRQAQELSTLPNLVKEQEKAQAEINKMKSPLELYDDFDVKNQELMKAYQEKKVDPNRLWSSMDTGSKIAASIGIVLGGFNLRGDNPAISIIDKAIDRDIKAQENDQSKAENLYKMNREAYGDKALAVNATKTQILTGVKYKMEAAAAQALNINAKTNAGVAAAQIDQKISALKWQRAILEKKNNINGSGLEGNASSVNAQAKQIADYYRATGDAAGLKDFEDHFVPGVGIAQLPVPEKNRENMAAKQEFMSRVKELRQLGANDLDKLDPIQRAKMHEASEMARNAFRLAYGEGSPTAGKIAFNEEAIPDPSKLLTWPGAIDARLDQLSKSVNDDLNSQRAQYVLPLNQASSGAIDAKVSTFMKNNPSVKTEAEAVKILKKAGKL